MDANAGNWQHSNIQTLNSYTLDIGPQISIIKINEILLILY